MKLSTYAKGYAASITCPYRERASNFTSGSLDFYRGGQHFYRKGMVIGDGGGAVENWLIRFVKDVVYALLVAGGAWLVFNAIVA